MSASQSTAPDSPSTTPEADRDSGGATTVHAIASPSKKRGVASNGVVAAAARGAAPAGADDNDIVDDDEEEDENIGPESMSSRRDEDVFEDDEVIPSEVVDMDDDSDAVNASSGAQARSGALGGEEGTLGGARGQPTRSSLSSSAKNRGGEMERRGEEKLLDERIRERYQQELGDIFDTRVVPA
ncbi:hypothetical protein FA10DRAFT_299441 [Acaromyces ingoldii]|uniref:Uncharacterized protein n=1 Tax=Acaromyces ingoldii TaxID=215250 RepID=A0A316Z1Q9_9BASI|nr:hypothetical protein FA10DRAFT_299441 [Acaromyces ingoldii]PWN94125.1 hypothetical protein FA10DRAFT_299441 [Acaromyces ingoldii]